MNMVRGDKYYLTLPRYKVISLPIATESIFAEPLQTLPDMTPMFILNETFFALKKLYMRLFFIVR